MSTNNPYQPGDGSDNGNVPPQEPRATHDPLANNPYSNQYQQAPAPDLDAGAPTLRSADMARMNRRAMYFLVAIVGVLVMLAVWMFTGAGGKKEAPKQREETVSVPQAPAPIPPPLPQVQPHQTGTPIPLSQRGPVMVGPPVTQAPPPPTAPRGPTLLERRMMADSSSQAATAGGGQPAGGAAAQALAAMQQQQGPRKLPGDTDPYGLPDVSNAAPLTDPDALMLRGTYIRCVLETRIITDIPGFTSCIVTEPVYSFNGRKLLLPKGSKVLGKYDMVPNSPRVAVIWDRIVTPTGIDVNMASPGVDNLGGSGHPGYMNSHWGSRIGAALLISMLSDAFSYEAAEHGPKNTSVSNGVITQTPFQSNTAQTLQNLAQQAVQRQANRPATVTINQGTIVSIYVAKDVDFAGVIARF